MSAEDDVCACKHLYEELCNCFVRKDSADLEKILANDYQLVHMTGLRQGKEAYIDAVMDGTLNYYSTHHDSIDVEVSEDGQRADICGKSRVEAAVFGGGRHTWRLEQDLKAEKRNGRWQLVLSKASTY